MPLLTGPADVLFCRFLVSHLAEPEDAIAKWATQLTPEGLLCMEEVDWIGTTQAVLTAYLEIVDALVQGQSTNLYVGPMLHGLRCDDCLRRRTSEVRRVQISSRRAAAMFYLNMQTWKHQDFVTANYAASTIRRLEHDLDGLRHGPDDTPEIEWGMRQLVFERVCAG